MSATAEPLREPLDRNHYDSVVQELVRPQEDPVSSRPVQLDDRDWLARRYAKHGDAEIAQQLGCAKATVLRARRRLNIPSREPGRQSGAKLRLTTDRDKPSSLNLFAERFHNDQRRQVPATDEHLIACCQGWLDAKQHHDQAATEDALLSIASAALLIHEHRSKLRKAA